MLADSLHAQELKRQSQMHVLNKDIQKEINNYMRAILVDWLVDVSQHFELMSETLHTAVTFIDRYLTAHKDVKKTELQLVGVSCLKIADVMCERSREYYRQDNAKEYAYITADEFTDK